MLMINVTLFGAAACGEPVPTSDSATETLSDSTADTVSEAITYEQITAEEAKALMDTQTGYVIVDARTEEEFSGGHIEGAMLIPEYEIADHAADKLPDKDQLILVYCRSGRRSKIASQALVELGYTNVKEFGGIMDWPYGVVQ